MSQHDDATTEFIETMGLRFQEQQMPRIAGRLFGLLLIEGGPLSFGELSDLLQVSRGSVSTNARMLAEFGLIERVGKPGDRQDHYRIVPDGMISLFRKQLARLSEADGFYRAIEARLPAHKRDARRRLVEMAVYSRRAAEGLELGLAKAEAELRETEPV